VSDDVTLIAGGGISGLATALALASTGRRSRVLERRVAFTEAGAGIQIGPNGTRLLTLLGVAAHLVAHVGVPDALAVRDGRSGTELTKLPLGPWIAGRHGAPYWTAHRADLHAALLAAATSQKPIEITTGFDLRSVRETDHAVDVTATDGRHATGRWLIGADGMNSVTRRLVFGDFDLRPNGRVAARAVVATDNPALTQNVGVWLAPRTHVVHYPVRGAREVAIVVVSPDAATPEGWSTGVDRAAVMARVKSLCAPLVELVAAAPEWRQWTLAETTRLPNWQKGRVQLIGDATGPIMPFLAQGAAMALEDAVTLAAALAGEVDFRAAFAAFEAARRPRRERVAATAARNGQIYHLEGTMAAARNLALRTVPATRVMAGYDWLYGHRL
jgi:salicylate hydroxylase